LNYIRILFTLYYVHLFVVCQTFNKLLLTDLPHEAEVLSLFSVCCNITLYT